MIKTKYSNKIILVTIGLLSGIMGFIVILFYRPWVIGNKLNDFKFSEYSPSFFYTFGFCLLLAGLTKKKQRWSIILVALGSLLYEIEQIWTSKIFDIMDLISIIVGFILALLVYEKLPNKIKASAQQTV